MEKIKILLVDDHEIVILGLKFLLSKNRDIEIVGITTDGEDTIYKVKELKPDVVVLDIGLPTISGIEVTEFITKKFPSVKVLLHTSYADEDSIVAGFEAGASGYVPKTFKADELIEAIRTVYRGERYMKGDISDTFVSNYFKAKKEVVTADFVRSALTPRQIDILKLLAAGVANQIIADKLHVSIRTVENHRYNIMRKLEINNTADLVKFAIKNNITSL